MMQERLQVMEDTQKLTAEGLQQAVEAEEAAAEAAREDCERVEAELAHAAEQAGRAREELERAKEMLKGGKSADFKAHKLSSLSRQRRELEQLVNNAHMELANAIDDVEREKRRFDQLLQVNIAGAA